MRRDQALGWGMIGAAIAILAVTVCSIDGRRPVVPVEPTPTLEVIVLPAPSPLPTMTPLVVPPKVDRLPTRAVLPTATTTSTPVPPTATETPTPNVTPPTQKG